MIKTLLIGGSGFVGKRLYALYKDSTKIISFPSKELDLLNPNSLKKIFESIWTDLIFSTTLEERIFDNLHPKGVLIMAKGQRLKPEQIVALLRQIDVLTTNGKTLAQACKEVGTVEQSYYRWRKIYGGMKVDQAKKYKELEQENTRLKKLVADLSLREVMLKEVIKGNF